MEKSPTSIWAPKILKAMLETLKENNKQMVRRDLYEKVYEKLQPYFDSWITEKTKTGNQRIYNVFNGVSIYAQNARLIQKKSGVWFLTEIAEKKMEKIDGDYINLWLEIVKAYSKRKKIKKLEVNNAKDNIEDNEEKIDIDEIQGQALDSIKKALKQKDPYELQDIVAALLRAMGYYIPYIAPPGKDGGIDVIAYRDPLGSVTPRIKVQVKHRDKPATAGEIRQLIGTIHSSEEMGLFVSTGGFTVDALNIARSSHVHIELVDLLRLIELWQEFYPKMPDEDKNLLPLVKIYFAIYM